MKLLISLTAAIALCSFSQMARADPNTSSFWTDLRTLCGTNSTLDCEQIVVPLIPGSSTSKPAITVGRTFFNFNPNFFSYFGTNLFRMPTNFSLPFAWGTNPVITLPGRQFPAPGVYKTEPYACIVVVPGPHADEKMAIGGSAEIESKMAIIKPDVRFVPWPRTGK